MTDNPLTKYFKYTFQAIKGLKDDVAAISRAVELLAKDGKASSLRIDQALDALQTKINTTVDELQGGEAFIRKLDLGIDLDLNDDSETEKGPIVQKKRKVDTAVHLNDESATEKSAIVRKKRKVETALFDKTRLVTPRQTLTPAEAARVRGIPCWACHAIIEDTKETVTLKCLHTFHIKCCKPDMPCPRCSEKK